MHERITRVAALLLVACTMVVPAAPPAVATPADETTSSSTATSTPSSSNALDALDAATQRVLELEERIEAHRAESIALEERMAVVNIRIIEQQNILAEAREELIERQTLLHDRLIRIYKSRTQSPVEMLLDAESLNDFFNRAVLLARIARRDDFAYRQAVIAEADAEYQASALDDLKAQLIELRRVSKVGTTELERALDEQRDLVDRLSEDALRLLQAKRSSSEMTRREWRDSSIPIGTPIPLGPATVEPYVDQTFLVASYQPTSYVATGDSFTAVCSWYGPGFNGRLTASGQVFNQDDLTCASRTLPFGTRLALTRGDRRIVVVVNDRGPFIPGRDLDLSKAAAAALGFSGVQPVHAEFVSVAD